MAPVQQFPLLDPEHGEEESDTPMAAHTALSTRRGVLSSAVLLLGMAACAAYAYAKEGPVQAIVAGRPSAISLIGVYNPTQGYCRGGPNWPGKGTVWKWLDKMPIRECEEQCNEDFRCGAYDRAKGECSLFLRGNEGDGEADAMCYLKPGAEAEAKAKK